MRCDFCKFWEMFVDTIAARSPSVWIKIEYFRTRFCPIVKMQALKKWHYFLLLFLFNRKIISYPKFQNRIINIYQETYKIQVLFHS